MATSGVGAATASSSWGAFMNKSQEVQMERSKKEKDKKDKKDKDKKDKDKKEKHDSGKSAKNFVLI